MVTHKTISNKSCLQPLFTTAVKVSALLLFSSMLSGCAGDDSSVLTPDIAINKEREGERVRERERERERENFQQSVPDEAPSVRPRR